mmetsp:Transcript_22833/g.77770  ORF Transcript_22833/g.77770 Transcript_22833/m.77770 type:complete len:226 (+) Transcript_22833:1562-2239(+)
MSSFPPSLEAETRSSRAVEACSRPRCPVFAVGEEGGEAAAPAKVFSRERLPTQAMTRSAARSAAARNISKVFLSTWFRLALGSFLAACSAFSARSRSASARAFSASARSFSNCRARSASSLAFLTESMSFCKSLKRLRKNSISFTFSRRSSNSAMSLGSIPAFVSTTFSGLRHPRACAISSTAAWKSVTISAEPSLELAVACIILTNCLMPSLAKIRRKVTLGSS